MQLEQVLDHFLRSGEFSPNIQRLHRIAAQPAKFSDFPSELPPQLCSALRRRGIDRLYSHQRISFDKIKAGRNVVVVTPTASGKTLCYNLPVLASVLNDPSSRALYLFPTKALSADQLDELYGLVQAVGADIKTYTFDGDTPATARKAIRSAGHIVITNPDMLHTGILPHHTRWVKLFENLRYVVIDEVHHYRGVFGSHLSNVLKRLHRICRFYGADPQFICASATIANPKELAEDLIGEEVELVDDNGAPRGEKAIILYNPPVVNRELGIRKSALHEANKIAWTLIANGIQTIVFARSRLRVEILTTYLKKKASLSGKNPNIISGYRGGYLPNERRRIERGLRDGSLRGVVSTNALELGIDIGQLEAAVLTGYPGSIASTWQQAGRAGRGTSLSLAVLVATSDPLDQYIVNNPDYFLGESPESGIIDAANLHILSSHVKCGAFELPFEHDEKFGGQRITDMLEYLKEKGLLHRAEGRYYWMSEIYPAEDISLRTASTQNFVILDQDDDNRVIGEIDYFSAPELIFPDAVYLHQSRQYQITRLDWDGKKAYAKEVGVDYYTDAQTKAELKVLDVTEKETSPAATGKASWGEVSVTKVTPVFKKIKFGTHENVGWGQIRLPEIEMHTTAFWYDFPEDVADILEMSRDLVGPALVGLAAVLRHVAPLWIMSDRNDLGAHSMVRSPFSGLPAVFLYDNYPGGVGFSRKIFNQYRDIFTACREIVAKCACTDGCPSCVGPTLESEHGVKNSVVKLIGLAVGQE